MKLPVRVLHRAERDLHEIQSFLEREAPLRAIQLMDRLLDAIESLGSLASRGARPRDAALRRKDYRYLVHEPYVIFYKVFASQVRVYRVLHGSRAYRHLL